MNKKVLQPILIVNAFLGIILGILGAIPLLNVISIISVFLLTGVCSLIFYLMKNPQNLSVSEAALLSSFGAFISAFCACVAFVPISIIFNLFGFATLLEGINVIILVFLMFFFSLICAMTNAFAGSSFMYIYNLFRK